MFKEYEINGITHVQTLDDELAKLCKMVLKFNVADEIVAVKPPQFVKFDTSGSRRLLEI